MRVTAAVRTLLYMIDLINIEQWCATALGWEHTSLTPYWYRHSVVTGEQQVREADPVRSVCSQSVQSRSMGHHSRPCFPDAIRAFLWRSVFLYNYRISLIRYPQYIPDNHKNFIHYFQVYILLIPQISRKSARNFYGYCGRKQTNKQVWNH